MIILLKDYMERDPGFLYEIITDSIEKGIKLVVNFRNVDKLTDEFLDESIGRVLRENDFDNIKHKLNFINVEKEIRVQLVEIVNTIVK